MANKTIKKEECPHAGEMKIASSEKTKCETRLPDGQVCDVKEHLRLCTSCGEVFCCESHNSHNREHFRESGHPIIKPAPTGDAFYTFTWCWKCNAYLE